MNREGLIHAIAEETDEPLGIVEQIVDAAIAHIKAAVSDGEPVLIEGFGRLRLNDLPANGNTPAYRQIHFRPAHQWRSQVNGRATDEHNEAATSARAREVGDG